jgi:cytochrome P450
MPVHTYPFNPPDRLVLDPMYAQLRADEPVARVQMPFGEPAWLVTRHADVRTVMSDPRFSRAEVQRRDAPRVAAHNPDGGILAMDPPDHTRLRKLVAREFTMRRVEALRPGAERIAAGLADAMESHGGPVDLVEAFALPLPVTVICELLGVPYADRDQFRAWSDAILSTTSLTPDQVRSSSHQFMQYMGGLIAGRRRQPTDDLLGALVRVNEEGDRLTDEELLSLAVTLLVAGHETTASQLPNFVFTLLTHPDERQLLQDKPELVPAAVEELMRWVPLFATAVFPRYAKEDVALGGVVIKAGDAVLPSIASANRDERVFADPDRIDFARPQLPQVGFGHGLHHCLGAPLARMELQVALTTLLSRFPHLRLATPEDQIPWKVGTLIRGPRRLEVAW